MEGACRLSWQGKCQKGMRHPLAQQDALSKPLHSLFPAKQCFLKPGKMEKGALVRMGQWGGPGAGCCMEWRWLHRIAAAASLWMWTWISYFTCRLLTFQFQFKKSAPHEQLGSKHTEKEKNERVPQEAPRGTQEPFHTNNPFSSSVSWSPGGRVLHLVGELSGTPIFVVSLRLTHARCQIMAWVSSACLDLCPVFLANVLSSFSGSPCPSPPPILLCFSAWQHSWARGAWERFICLLQINFWTRNENLYCAHWHRYRAFGGVRAAEFPHPSPIFFFSFFFSSQV